MKKNYLLVLLMPLFLLSCSDGKLSDSGGGGVIPGITELVLNQKISGKISEDADVDIYHYRADRINSVLRIRCTSNTLRPDVDLLLSVYRLNEKGEKEIIYADHAREDSLSPADITMNIFVGEPTDLYIYVRDLKDDDFSENPYYLTVDFETAPEGNDTLADAELITVDDAESCKTGTIGYIGDVDVYSFNADSNGIYDIQTIFTPFKGGSDIELSIKVYNGNGELIHTLSEKQKSYNTLFYLTAGKYYLLVDDYGMDDFDNASSYNICVNSASSDELFENDNADNASVPSDLSSITGSLDYLGDQDWYAFDVADTGGISFVDISFDDTGDTDLDYLIKVVDSDGALLLSHLFRGNSEYQTRIKADPGSKYLIIQTADGEIVKERSLYTASINVVTVAVDDAGETTGNSIDEAIELQSGEIAAGAISYRGDNDWYSISVNTAAPQILEVLFNAGSSDVEYDIKIIRDGVVKRVFNPRSTDEATELKTSILIPAGEPAADATYMIKLADYQEDDGDDAAYSLQVNLVSVPGAAVRNGALYHNEAEEQINNQETIELVYNALTQKQFNLNQQLLDPLNPPEGSITSTSEETVGENIIDVTTIAFPWIGGFIDFQGDQDWFLLPNSPLNEDDTSWYYDIKIEMQTDAPGSQVEYVWRYYPDRNKNRRVMLGYSSSGDDGMMASAGDTTTEVDVLDITVPDTSRSPDEKFWVGSRWQGDAYLSISDFNYTDSSEPDDDWGYDAGYYLKVTLTYYSGISYPG